MYVWVCADDEENLATSANSKIKKHPSKKHFFGGGGMGNFFFFWYIYVIYIPFFTLKGVWGKLSFLYFFFFREGGTKSLCSFRQNLPRTFSSICRRGEFSIFSKKNLNDHNFFVFSKNFMYLCVVRVRNCRTVLRRGTLITQVE